MARKLERNRKRKLCASLICRFTELVCKWPEAFHERRERENRERGNREGAQRREGEEESEREN